MAKVLAVVEIEMSGEIDPAVAVLSTDNEFTDIVDDVMSALPDIIYQAFYNGIGPEEATRVKEVSLLSARVLNTTTAAALNHLYPRTAFDLETWGGPSSRRIMPTGPRPDALEALMLFGADVSAVDGEVGCKAKYPDNHVGLCGEIPLDGAPLTSELKKESSFPEELRGEIGEKGMQGPRSFVGPCSADCYPGCPCGNWVIAPKTIADLPYEERRQYVKKIEITDGVSTETYKDGSCLSGPIGLSGGIGPVGVAPDLTAVETRIKWYTGMSIDSEGTLHHHDFTRPHSQNAPSRRYMPVMPDGKLPDGSFVEFKTSNVIRPDRVAAPIDVSVERVIEIDGPNGERYRLPLDENGKLIPPDPLKEESDMLKKLREFFTDPFAKFNRNRIPTVKTHGSVTGRVPHRAENSGLQSQAADDIQAAILAAYVNSPHTVVFGPTTILTDDDLSDLDGRAKQVVDMANSGLEPVRETSSFWDAPNAIDRDTDARTSTPVEDSAPSYASRSADEDRSAAAAVESRDTSSYESSSSSSSSDSYSSSSDSSSYSSSSSDSSYSSSSDSGSSYSVD